MLSAKWTRNADLKIAEIELMEIKEVKDFNLDNASVAVKRISDIKTAHHLGILKAMIQMRSILTEEQFNKMHKMMMSMESCDNKPAKMMMQK